MKTITAQKPWEEIVGCGNCATMCRTGGKSQALEMKERLEAIEKGVTGWMMIPTACDELTRYALRENARDIQPTDCILAMTCAFGVQTIALYLDKPMPVYPALDTLFIGLEESPGYFVDVCTQCGNCRLGSMAGICPLIRCTKGLLNGPCGGSAGGRREISPDVPCAWQMIIDCLQAIGRLYILDEIVPPHDWSTSRSGGSRVAIIEV